MQPAPYIFSCPSLPIPGESGVTDAEDSRAAALPSIAVVGLSSIRRSQHNTAQHDIPPHQPQHPNSPHLVPHRQLIHTSAQCSHPLPPTPQPRAKPSVSNFPTRGRSAGRDLAPHDDVRLTQSATPRTGSASQDHEGNSLDSALVLTFARAAVSYPILQLKNIPA